MRRLPVAAGRSRAPESSSVVRSRSAKRATVDREHPVRRLQHVIGNQAIQRMLRTESAVPQISRTDADGAAHVGVPPLVDDVLAQSGETFDTSTRDFMERRLGHDFGHVRVHTDSVAARSAHSIDALAFTAGHHIVFGAGQYAPHTSAGRRLMAHELTHVVQQTTPEVIHRQPAPDKAETASDARLQTLAEYPALAHQAWGQLNEVERTSVVIRMNARYGQDFANSFLWYTKNPKQRRLYSEGSNVSYRTPDWFKAHGYHLRTISQGSVREQFLQFWVHPSGHSIDQIVDKSTGVSKGPGPIEQVPPPPPPPEVDCKEVATLLVSILDGAIETETKSQSELEAEKGKLEKLNKTTDSYCTRFDQYEADLKAMSARVDSDVDDIEGMRKLLTDGKCRTPAGIDPKLDVLRDLGIWADVEVSPMSTQFLKCIKIRGPIDMPDDDDS
jgi:hypothetical protein